MKTKIKVLITIASISLILCLAISWILFLSFVISASLSIFRPIDNFVFVCFAVLFLVLAVGFIIWEDENDKTY